MKTYAKVMICQNRYILRSVEPKDAEILRFWKNLHKEFFFHKKEISQEEQHTWINSLAKKTNDHMFIIMDDEKPIGCIGARLCDGFVDVYNVILGDKNYKGQHVMKNALWAVVSLCNLIFRDKSIFVSVLKNNPAINWYEKIGFKIIDSREDHVIMQFEKTSILSQYNFNIDVTLPII